MIPDLPENGILMPKMVNRFRVTFHRCHNLKRVAEGLSLQVLDVSLPSVDRLLSTSRSRGKKVYGLETEEGALTLTFEDDLQSRAITAIYDELIVDEGNSFTVRVDFFNGNGDVTETYEFRGSVGPITGPIFDYSGGDSGNRSASIRFPSYVNTTTDALSKETLALMKLISTAELNYGWGEKRPGVVRRSLSINVGNAFTHSIVTKRPTEAK